MEPAITDLIGQMRRNLARAGELTHNLDHGSFNWREAPEKWSAGQCLQHLTLVAQTDFPHLDRAIANARKKGILGAGPFDYGWFTNWFMAILEPPPKFRVPSPRPFRVPPQDVLRDAVVQGYRDAVGGMVARLEACDGLDLARAKTILPALAWVKMPIGGRFAVMAAHDRRHLWQIERILQARSRAAGLAK